MKPTEPMTHLHATNVDHVEARAVAKRAEVGAAVLPGLDAPTHEHGQPHTRACARARTDGLMDGPTDSQIHTHARTRARTHARMHAHTCTHRSTPSMGATPSAQRSSLPHLGFLAR